MLTYYLFHNPDKARFCRMIECLVRMKDGDEATLRFHIKGGRHKTKGIQFSAAESIAEYIKAAGIESGRLCRPRLSQHHETLAPRRMTERSMYRVLMSYLERLPGAMRETVLPNGKRVRSASIHRTHCGRQRRHCCSIPACRLNPSRISSTTSTLRQRRFTTNAAAPCGIPPRTKCRFETSSGNG